MAHWDTSPAWAEARRAGYEPAASVEVWQDGAYATTLAATGGAVTVDEGSATRRTLDLPVADIELDPKDADDLLAPFGTELHVYGGMKFAGTTELVPVGVFALDTTSRGSWFGDLSLKGMDRMGVLAEARFLQPWNTYAGTYVVDEIAAMALSVLPDIEVYDLTGSDATCRAATWERERVEAMTNLARGIGAEVFFDQAGRLIIRDTTTVADLLVFGQDPVEVHANRDDSDLLEVSTSMSRANVYNAVVASSDQAVPVTAVAYQASGPLRYRPGFQKPRFFSTPVVTTYDGIGKSAASILQRSLAYSRALAGEIIPDASLEAGSLVQWTNPDEETTLRILSQFQLPLGAGSMSVQTRVDADVAITDDTEGLA